MDTIVKQSETEIKITTPKEQIISLTDLKEKYTDAQDLLIEFEKWVITERTARQKRVDDALFLITQAQQLGVTEPK